jgi:hypothetical protein
MGDEVQKINSLDMKKILMRFNDAETVESIEVNANLLKEIAANKIAMHKAICEQIKTPPTT